jgi:tetratricopeptide (TPR) repeat protein
VVELTPPQIVKAAKVLIDEGKLSEAKILLTAVPFADEELETERLFLLGMAYRGEGKFDEAIEVFRLILDAQPDLPRVRLELAATYMAQGSWYRADYHMRLAGASKDLPEGVANSIKKFLYIIRQNKNWNAWFNFGLAPDNNLNGSEGGEECIATIFGLLCRQLPDPEKATGFNLSAGGNYEYKFNRSWGLKNDFAVFSNTYDKSKYDDLYIMASTGPRYVWGRGDIWAAITAGKRYLGHDPYSSSIGAKIDANYDFTNRVSGGLYLKYTPTRYDDYGDMMEGDTKGATVRLTYMFGASMYATLRAGIEKETAKDEVYSNLRRTYGIGFGAELPAGFRIYIEPSILFTDYDGERWVVKDYGFAQVREEDKTRRYTLSVSNSKIDIWGFTPQITYSYADRSSNIWQKEYSKNAVEFSMQQRF